MSDEAINWDDFGGDEPAAKLLPAGDYTGKITYSAWAHADWAAAKVPESGGKIMKVKVEIDAPTGFAEAWTTVPAVKARGWQFRLICGAAGVEAPVSGGPAWSPAILIGKSVLVTTSIYTNERTGESKVQIDKWLPGAVQAEAPQAAAKQARRTQTQKADAASATIPNDDIPFLWILPFFIAASQVMA